MDSAPEGAVRAAVSAARRHSVRRGKRSRIRSGTVRCSRRRRRCLHHRMSRKIRCDRCRRPPAFRSPRVAA
jgi:hypothetical protein